MDSHLAALVLEEIASLLSLTGAERFRVRAYRTAARAVDRVEGDLGALLESGELAEVPGLGPATLGVIRELVQTGRSRLYDRLRTEAPAGLVQLRSVSGLGPKRIRVLHEKLGIETLEDLRAAAEAGRVAALPGFGPATQARILSGLGFVDRSAGRRRQPESYATAARLVGHLESLSEGHPREVRIAGELRRGCETVDGVDLLTSCDDPHALFEAFLELPGLSRPERTGPASGRASLADGSSVRLQCVAPEELGAAWILATGSAAHVEALTRRAGERGLRLSEDGLWRDDERLDSAEEASIYGALDLDWVPPELREGSGEIDAAESGTLPRLVRYEDLRGTFHCHTTWSDGRATIAEMAEAAAERGWRYLGIADHSASAGYAGGLTVEQVRAQQREIDAWNAEHGDRVRVFKGTESDILRDGRLDYPDEVLASFEYVIGSVHSALRIGEAPMTRRLTAAVRNPYLTILGHPTGRLLLHREPYEVDLGAVAAAAGEAGKVIEINGDPHRMDMDWRYWPDAKAAGVRCAVDPDAHSVAGLSAVAYGVRMARKGWLEAEDVICTWELDRVEAYLRDR